MKFTGYECIDRRYGGEFRNPDLDAIIPWHVFHIWRSLAAEFLKVNGATLGWAKCGLFKFLHIPVSIKLVGMVLRNLEVSDHSYISVFTAVVCKWGKNTGANGWVQSHVIMGGYKVNIPERFYCSKYTTLN